MKSIRLALFLCSLASVGLGASFRDNFAVVFIDAASEAKFGAFPLDRSLLAKAIRQAGDLRAKGVVMKFFLDRPGDAASDLVLACALTNLPVLLQARIDDQETHPNPLPSRFILARVNAPTLVSGRSGWLPHPMFAANANDVGFVDFSSTQVPVLETYQSRTVKSLVVCCIELASGKPATIATNGRMKFGTNELRVDGRNCVASELPAKDDLEYIPFHQFLTGEIPANRIKGKVVIIGYDGAQMHSIATPIGPVRAHRFFVYVLLSIYGQVDT